MSIIIGIDHGYYAIKTAHCSFPAGLTSYGLSNPQLEFLLNASEGHGILKMGNSMIPFSNLEPKDTAVYKLITTKPGEATAEK